MLAVEQGDKDTDIQKGTHELNAFFVADAQHIVRCNRWTGTAGNRGEAGRSLKPFLLAGKLVLPQFQKEFLHAFKLLRAQLAQGGFDFGDAHGENVAVLPFDGKPALRGDLRSF